MKDTGFWLIGYAYWGRSAREWRFENIAINKDPGEWLLESRERDADSRYTVIMALAISKSHYEKIHDHL